MIRLRVLGGCGIEVGGGWIGPESERLFAALLYLAVERGKSVGRGAIIRLLWPGVADDNGRHNLRQILYKARRAGAPVECTQSHLYLPSEAVDADFAVPLSPEAVDAWARSGAAAAGDFLPGYTPTFSEPFAEWVEDQRGYVHSQLRRALTGAMLDRRARGDWAAVDTLARQVLRLDPLNEEGTLALAEATALGGGKARALSILDHYLAELGPAAADIRIPATVLRRRIAERFPPPRYAAPSEAHFIGRSASMAVLTALLRGAKAGPGRACLVWGPSGIGKTRLTTELFKVAALQGVQTQRVGCQPSDTRRPLSVFVDLVPLLLNVPGAIGCSPRSMTYLKRLTEHDTKAAAPSEETREAEYLYANVRQALFDLFDAVAAEGCLVLLVEDVHWLDVMSWEVFRGLIEWMGERRILFIFTSRTPHATSAPTAEPVRGLEHHELPPLDAGASGALLTALANDRKQTPNSEFADWAIPIAEGNPLFLRELVTAWEAAGGRPAVPPSLTALIGERLARLQPEALRVLQACAVLGKNATFARLEAVLGYEGPELLDGVHELEAHKMLGEDSARVPVKHYLLADAALALLGDASRRLLHRRVGAVLEREVEETHSASLLWDCAEQLQKAGEAERAVKLAKVCAEHLVDVGLAAQAVEIYRRADPLCTTEVQRLELLEPLQYALAASSQWNDVIAVIASARSLRSQITPGFDGHHEDELRLLQAHRRLNSDLRGLIGQAKRCANDTLATSLHRVRAATWGFVLADDMCAELELHEIFRSIEDILDANTVDELSRHTAKMVFHTACGDLQTGVESARALIAYQREVDNPASLARTLLNGAAAHRRAGLFQIAYNILEEAFGIAERHSLISLAVPICDQVCAVLLDQGHTADAKAWYTRAVLWASRAVDPICTDMLAHLSAHIALTEGRLGDVQRSLNFSPEHTLNDSHLKRRAHTEATWVRLQLAQGADLSDDRLLSDLERIHPACRTLGCHDFCAFALHIGLLSRGEKDKADRLLLDYVQQYRRELGPLPPEFMRLASVHP
jgi:DNA-binding SARP family transcriptional activator/predicted ATPase